MTHVVAGTTTTSQQAAIAAVWDQHRPEMVERVELLERAQVDPTLRVRAREAAHQLAGTVGTFGFPLASELARRCELLLDSDAAAHEMAEWVADIRAEIADVPSEETVTGPEARLASLPLVLVVTEAAGTAERLRTEGRRRGLRVTIARVADAAAKLGHEAPAAMLMDLSAEGALDLLPELRRDHPDVPALVMTDHDSFEDRLEAARRGATGLLDRTATPADAIDHLTLKLQRRAGLTDRVLVVGIDDAVRAALGDAGVEVVTLPDSGDPWEDLNRVNPGLILIGAANLELARVVRNDRRWAIIPIVVVGPADLDACFAAGADDVTSFEEVVPRVCNHLARHRVHQSLAETDPLTGLRNRRTSTAALSHLLRLAERLAKPVSIVELDVDHFKRVNDTYGHMAGDAVLRRLGELLKGAFRGEDVVARWGGEEFVVGLFGLDREGGIDRVADLLGRFRAETFTDAEGRTFSCTFSAGVAQFPADGADLESLYGAADEALYAAKSAGRDQVTGAGYGPNATQQVDVAIIEDEDATSELIAHTLNDRGLRCFRFSNGAGAVQMLLGERPRVRARVILLDLNLPAVDGMELLTLFAREGVLRSTRAIVVSVRDDPATMARARALGAVDYLVKPVDLDELSVHVDTALGRR